TVKSVKYIITAVSSKRPVQRSFRTEKKFLYTDGNLASSSAIMKILHPRQHAHTTSVAWALCLIASSLTLLFSSALMCQAQTCSPTPAPPPDACPPFNYQNCTSPV